MCVYTHTHTHTHTYIYICIFEPLCSPPETITLLLVSCIPLGDKKLKKRIFLNIRVKACFEMSDDIINGSGKCSECFFINRQGDCLNMSYCGNSFEVYIKSSSFSLQEFRKRKVLVVNDSDQNDGRK